MIKLCDLDVLSFLDRGNIGNAKVAGMNKDLGKTPPRELFGANIDQKQDSQASNTTLH
jgi:hypothetical protein